LKFSLTDAINKSFSLGTTLKSEKNTEIYCIFYGEVISCSNDPLNQTNLGKYVEVLTKGNYYYNKQNNVFEVRVVYSNLSDIDKDIIPGYQITSRKVIGHAGERSSPLAANDDVMISMYSLERIPYLEFYTKSASNFLLGLNWYYVRNIIFGKTPSPNPFTYEEIDVKNYDFKHADLNKSVRFQYKLDRYPIMDDPDFVNLFMSATMNNLIKLQEDIQYSAINTYKYQSQKIMILWPDTLTDYYKEQNLLGKKMYLYTRVVAQDNDKTLLVVDFSTDKRLEELITLKYLNSNMKCNTD
jgi:hypothetical protein